MELIDLVSSVIIFLSQMTLLRRLAFLLGSLTKTLTVLLFWIYLFLLLLVFYRIAYEFFRTDWDDLCDDLRDVSWQDIFKLSASAASEFCEWVQVGIDVYTSHRKISGQVSLISIVFQLFLLLP